MGCGRGCVQAQPGPWRARPSGLSLGGEPLRLQAPTAGQRGVSAASAVTGCPVTGSDPNIPRRVSPPEPPPTSHLTFDTLLSGHS
ncbi:hypothetical protein AAFF_G00262770 [Aldrovandia affinis]|uniref:Uncharacterized protein n=1 Tax=Aldrovandia affinis TaxID=143900 RepID=A0AAD7SSN3_9TELE|nr:hypothetical protein AAFF_G00262770 [Aldrovandia affinis]